MARVAASEIVTFTGNSEGVPALMTIYAPSVDELAIQRLTPAEAREHGEEPLQLLEGLRYEYELANKTHRLMQETGVGVVKQSTNPSLAYCGTLVTGLHTGKLVLLVLDCSGELVGTAALEIRPRKIGHRDHYRQMLEEITDVCVDLAMELRAPTNMKASPSPGTSSQTIHQRFSFLKALINSRAFQDALHRISTHPHKKWQAEERIIDVRRGFRSNAKTMREIAKAPRRVPVPITHPLSRVLPTVPERIPTFSSSQTEDTKENRFIKFALEAFVSFLRSMHLKLDELAADKVRRGYKNSETDSRLQAQISLLESNLLHSLNADVFRSLSQLDTLPLGSPVLQRKEGYREVFQAWLKFDMAARLVWHGGDDVYGAGQRNIATLYEYWIFFKLLSLIGDYFQFTVPLSKTLIEETEDGFGLKLKSGQHLAFDATFENGSRRLRVQFGYNRTFVGNAQHEIEGSWTERMRPDYTLSLWPCETGNGTNNSLSAEEAERQDLMVHVHFDAKYRIDDLQEIFGREGTHSDDEGQVLAEKKYKRDDLLKMHSYRDAIRRTHGAYVLYPGDAQKGWEEYREILPGLGAFPLSPGNGDKALRRFIDDVVQHVCDRATQREQSAFYNYRIHSAAKPRSIFAEIPEIHSPSGERLLPFADTKVLVAASFSETHFEWSIKNRSFAVFITKAGESASLTTNMLAAKYALISTPSLVPINTFVKIGNSAPRVLTGENLQIAGCPDTDVSAIYLVFDIEKEPIFATYKWETEFCTMPKIMRLDEVIYQYSRS